MASLKLRVSRLEATLRAKEQELARLQASAKATALNEMKIEAETYYQEVRLAGWQVVCFILYSFVFFPSFLLASMGVDGLFAPLSSLLAVSFSYKRRQLKSKDMTKKEKPASCSSWKVKQ